MNSTQTTDFPPATPAREHAACRHGLGDLAGYVVTYTRFDPAAGETTYEDIVWIRDATQYDQALEAVRNARRRIEAGLVDATYAVIHHVYEDGHRMR